MRLMLRERMRKAKVATSYGAGSILPAHGGHQRDNRREFPSPNAPRLAQNRDGLFLRALVKPAVPTQLGQSRAQVHCRCGFTHAAFLIGNRQNTHAAPL